MTSDQFIATDFIFTLAFAISWSRDLKGQTKRRFYENFFFQTLPIAIENFSNFVSVSTINSSKSMKISIVTAHIKLGDHIPNPEVESKRADRKILQLKTVGNCKIYIKQNLLLGRDHMGSNFII